MFFRMSSAFCHEFQKASVGIGQLAVVDAANINQRGLRVIVPQSFGDDMQVNLSFIGHARPGVAHHIGSESCFQLSHLRQLPQVVVILRQLPSVVAIGIYPLRLCQDGEYQFALCMVIARNDFFYLRLDGNMDGLMRLPSVVGNATIADLVASQESHIDKRHTQTVKTEEKHIARQGQPAPHWQL